MCDGLGSEVKSKIRVVACVSSWKQREKWARCVRAHAASRHVELSSNPEEDVIFFTNHNLIYFDVLP